MRTIAIMNNKGGVGKTITAVNLADILVREHGKRVIVADCDGQMNASRMLAPALPRLPPGPVLSHGGTAAAALKDRKCSASSDRAEPSDAETAEFIRLLKLHPEKYGAVRQILSCGRGNAPELMKKAVRL